MDIIIPKTSITDVQDIQETMENDLHAFYSLLQREVLNAIESDTGTSFDGILEKIEALFA